MPHSQTSKQVAQNYVTNRPRGPVRKTPGIVYMFLDPPPGSSQPWVDVGPTAFFFDRSFPGGRALKAARARGPTGAEWGVPDGVGRGRRPVRDRGGEPTRPGPVGGGLLGEAIIPPPPPQCPVRSLGLGPLPPTVNPRAHPWLPPPAPRFPVSHGRGHHFCAPPPYSHSWGGIIRPSKAGQVGCLGISLISLPRA